MRRVSCATWTDALVVLPSAPPERPWEEVSFRFPPFAVTADVSAIIFGLPFRGNLRELRLAKVMVGDAGAVALASGGWTRLERLDVTDAGFRALAAAPFVHQLTHVRPGMNGVRPLPALRDRFGPRFVEH